MDEKIQEGNTHETILFCYMIVKTILPFTYLFCVEGEYALEVEDDECKIITEKTVFDHIREKAKNFSLLSAFDNICCPPLEVLLARNHAHDKRPALSHDVVVLDDADRPKVPQTNEANLPAELRKAERNGIHNTAGSSNNMSNIVETGGR